MTELGELPAVQSQVPGPRVAWRWVLLVAGVAAAIHLTVATRYGWHRDEFYYVITGRHLAAGYVDQPPLAPLLARFAADLPGGLLPLRILAIVAQIGSIVLAGRLAAEFGGRTRAQVIAAAAIAASPAFVGASMLWGTTVLDQLCWGALFVAVARALRVRTIGAWLVAGVIAGIGSESKDTIAALLIGVTVGLVTYRRDVLRTPGPWLAGVVAVVLALPDVVWNVMNGWPQAKMAGVLAARTGGPLGSLEQLPMTLLLVVGLPLVGLWVLGVRWLVSREGRDHRWVLVVGIVVIVLFTISGGKDYYPAPAFAALFAAGAVHVEASATRSGRVWWPVLIVVSAVVSMLVGLPFLPPSAATAIRGSDPELMETYGWPQFADQVERVAKTLPPGTVVFTSNYGEAGALTMFGAQAGLRNPVASGQNAYSYWGPPPGTPDTVLCLGEFAPSYLHRFWSQVREIAPITLPDGLQDEETTHHAAMYLCQQPHGTWAQLWPSLRHFS